MATFNPPSEQSLEFLKPYRVADELFALPSGEQIPIAKYFLSFKEWHGEPIPNTYGNKTVIDHNGEPVFAELAVLRLFHANGWQGVWADSYGRKFRTGLPGIADPITLPPEQQKFYDEIKLRTGLSGGCWDLFLWRGNEVLFVELKRQKKDRVQDSQIRWLTSSLGLEMKTGNFALIEWKIQNPN